MEQGSNFSENFFLHLADTGGWNRTKLVILILNKIITTVFLFLLRIYNHFSLFPFPFLLSLSQPSCLSFFHIYLSSSFSFKSLVLHSSPADARSAFWIYLPIFEGIWQKFAEFPWIMSTHAVVTNVWINTYTGC